MKDDARLRINMVEAKIIELSLKKYQESIEVSWGKEGTDLDDWEKHDVLFQAVDELLRRLSMLKARINKKMEN